LAAVPVRPAGTGLVTWAARALATAGSRSWPGPCCMPAGPGQPS